MNKSSNHNQAQELSIALRDEESTAEMGANLASVLLVNNTDAISAHIHLIGDLGAGKTSLARAFLRACGVEGRIKSPSYALLESYNVSRLTFYHLDFYRFTDPQEWVDAGFRDILQGDNIVIIEWPDRAGELLPRPDLEIRLNYAEQGRKAVLTSHSTKGTLWLTKLATKKPN